VAVRCPECQHENPDDTLFCGKCGTQFPSPEEVKVTETLEAPKEELTTGSTFADRYQIIEELGKGGMGRVYKAHDTKIKEKIALKLIKPEIAKDKKTIERFSNELRLARKIRHKNVCGMFDLGEEKGTHYITMEFVPGEDLRSSIRRFGQLPIGKSVSIAAQICDGLAEAHRLGVVHRDLKSNNIMIDKDGNVRIMDFGIARSLEAKGITGAGVMIGTPEYMSPEQVEGKEIDQRSDIYSLGVILYEMVTGRVPFEGDTPFTIGIKHKSEIPKSPKELNTQIPDDLSRVILKCLEKAKEKRYQSVAEVRSELTNIEKGIPTTEKTIPERKPLTSREITVTFGMKKVLIPALIFIAVVIIAVVAWLVLPKKETTPLPASDKPTLAVLYFENNTGDGSLDHWRKGLSELLITDLTQSKYLKVLSGDRIYNILKNLNLLESKDFSSDDLGKIVSQGGATHILRGGYTRAAETFRIDIMLQEGKTGESLGSHRVQGEGEGSFFALVDELTKEIKDDFKLSSEEIARDIDKEIGQITTSSPEAYKYLLEGGKHHSSWKYREAIPLYEKAVEIDPGFAMAYRALAMAHSNLGDLTKRKEYIEKALELSDRISDGERYLIQGDYYSTSEKTYDRAIEAYKKLTTLYPDNWIGHNNLGVVYDKTGEFEKAAERFEIAVKIAGGMLHYDNLAYDYVRLGLYDKARALYAEYLEDVSDIPEFHGRIAEIYIYQRKYDLALEEAEKAFVLDPTNYRIPRLKGDIYHLMGDFFKAEEEYKKYLEAREETHSTSKWRLAALNLTQGKFQKAIDWVKMAIDLDPTTITSHRYLGYINWRVGNHDDSLENLNKATNRYLETDRLSGYRRTLNSKGITLAARGSLTEAQQTADELESLFQKSPNKKEMRYYYYLIGFIESKRKNLSKAIDFFQRAKSLLPYEAEITDDHAAFLEPLAHAYYESGDMDKAQAEYESISLLTGGRLYFGDIYAKSFYMLGKIYEQQGDTAKTIEHYEKFLDLWKDADPGMAEVDDARERLARLKGEYP
jgi:serine/threonine protein kinase/tetratricopeptide (TPR) repeat protein